MDFPLCKLLGDGFCRFCGGVRQNRRKNVAIAILPFQLRFGSNKQPQQQQNPTILFAEIDKIVVLWSELFSVFLVQCSYTGLNSKPSQISLSHLLKIYMQKSKKLTFLKTILFTCQNAPKCIAVPL
jgi:hypothetical protein